jgi:hypothetical protein
LARSLEKYVKDGAHLAQKLDEKSREDILNLCKEISLHIQTLVAGIIEPKTVNSTMIELILNLDPLLTVFLAKLKEGQQKLDSQIISTKEISELNPNQSPILEISKTSPTVELAGVEKSLWVKCVRENEQPKMMKIKYGFTLDQLLQAIKQKYGTDFNVSYKDSAGDLIPLTCNEDLEFAFEDFSTLNSIKMEIVLENISKKETEETPLPPPLPSPIESPRSSPTLQ